jgi:hypothetical protein
MAGNLDKHFYNAVVEGKTFSDEWKDEAFLVDVTRCSSANWCTHANAIGYIIEGSNPRYRDWWLNYFTQSRYRLFGKEPFSRIYSAWIIIPVVAVFKFAEERRDMKLQEEAQSWLKAAWTHLAFSAYPVRHVFKYFRPGMQWRGFALSAAGARSWERERVDGGPPIGNPYHIDGWALDWILYRALNGIQEDSRPVSGWDDYHLTILNTLESKKGEHWSGLSFQDAETLNSVIRNPSIENVNYGLNLVKNYKPMAEFRFYRFENGACTIMPRFGVSNATAPLYGKSVYRDGTIGLLSCDPGARPTAGWPNAVSPGEVTLDLNTRVATVKRLTGEQLDVLAIPEMKLPDGELIFEIVCGGEYTAQLVKFKNQVVTPPNTDTPTDPNTKPDIPNIENPEEIRKQFYNKNGAVDSFKLARSVASVRTPKDTKEVGQNIVKLSTVFWDTCSKFMNSNIQASDYKRAYEAYSGLVSMVSMCGQFLITGNKEHLDNIKKGLMDVYGKI